MAKEYDNITEVRKFNPFHDSLGKFSSAQGMRTYSANPKTKAGRMAIERSAKNHGTVMNVHRESKGENIAQNYNWIKTGQKPAVPAAQAKPKATAKPKNTAKPATPKTTAKPKAPAKQQVDNSKRQYVKGKDLTKTLQRGGGSGPGGQFTIDDVVSKQGFKGKPQVITDKAGFDAAVKKAGTIGFRTINDGTDVVTGKRKTASEFIDTLMNGDEKTFSLNGSGGKAYGAGLYIARTTTHKNTVPSAQSVKNAEWDSKCYGMLGKSKTMQMTLSPTAKIGSYRNVYREYSQSLDRFKYRDVAAYAAAKGYDGLHVQQGRGYGYTMLYNRSALICYDPGN